MSLRLRFVACLSLVFFGCPSGEGDPPPLFNAKDLSVQCNTGYVGWDFSTGGNDTAIVENSVSREITVDSATLGICNYKDDFAADCDGKRDCSRLVKKSTSPTCAGGELKLRYHCGEETPRYDLVIAADASAKTVTLGCGEPITIVSAVYASNAPTQANRADLSNAVGTACTGKRRCSLDDPYALNNYSDPWPNQYKNTAIRYYCGTDPVVKETIVPSGSRVDILCPNVDGRAPLNDTMRIQGVTCSNSNCDSAQVASWETKLRNKCEGKESCSFKLDAFVAGQSVPQMTVAYWCTTPQAPETRVFFDKDLYESALELHCGVPIRIVGTAENFSATILPSSSTAAS